MATFTHWNKKEKIHSEIGFEKDDHLYAFQVYNLNLRHSTQTPVAKTSMTQCDGHKEECSSFSFTYINSHKTASKSPSAGASPAKQKTHHKRSPWALNQWARLLALQEQLMEAMFALSTSQKPLHISKTNSAKENYLYRTIKKCH